MVADITLIIELLDGVLKMANTIDFETAFSECVSKDKAEFDERYGADGDVIAVIGTALFDQSVIAIARMIAPGDIRPFTKHIFVRREHNAIIFSDDNTLLLAAEWNEMVDEFIENAEKTGFFVFEGIMLTRMNKALVDLDGNVIETRSIPISKDEYEKYLAGFYHTDNPPTAIKFGQA